MARIIINTDGGARGNPGPAAAGGVIKDESEIVATVSKYLGTQTNNWAEYEALILAIEAAYEHFGEEMRAASVEIRMDSQLVVRQIEGRYKVKEPALKLQHARATGLLERYAPHAVMAYVPREENAEADRLVNESLDRAAAERA